MLCLSQPTTCTCQVTGNTLTWIVRFPNGNNAGVITHIRPPATNNFDLDTPYQLSNDIGFDSTLTATANAVINAILSFTAHMSLERYSIVCTDNNLVNNVTIDIQGSTVYELFTII